MKRILDKRYDDVLAALPEALRTEGFGVLTEIDVQATLKQKINVDFRRYRILGACNPTLAHRALSVNLDVGVLLPCNVTVYESDDGKTVASTIDPLATLAGADATLRPLAEEVRAKLARVLERL